MARAWRANSEKWPSPGTRCSVTRGSVRARMWACSGDTTRSSLAVPDLDRHRDPFERHTPGPGLEGQIVRRAAPSLPERLGRVPVESLAEPRHGQDLLVGGSHAALDAREERVRVATEVTSDLGEEETDQPWSSVGAPVQPPVLRVPRRAGARQVERTGRRYERDPCHPVRQPPGAGAGVLAAAGHADDGEPSEPQGIREAPHQPRVVCDRVAAERREAHARAVRGEDPEARVLGGLPDPREADLQARARTPVQVQHRGAHRVTGLRVADRGPIRQARREGQAASSALHHTLMMRLHPDESIRPPGMQPHDGAQRFPSASRPVDGAPRSPLYPRECSG